jgi:predicted restriction endonuclease
MPARADWTRHQLLVAFNLYCQIPFGQLHSRNPEIIKYADLINRTPSALAMKLSNIASLDPVITSTGRKGLSNASSADNEMWEEMQSNWEQFTIQSLKAKNSFGTITETDISDDNKAIEDADHTGKEKYVQSTVRVGQSFFRKSVLSSYDNRCCITGLENPKLLIASHIIPWSVDERNRLNPRNSLCLSALHDKAFDAGIITIEKNLTVRVSRNFEFCKDSFFEKAILKYDGEKISMPMKFQPNEEYLSYHRENIFESLG